MITKNSILIYTTSDFPYGKASENFVRQMALGLKKNNYNVIIIRLRGRSFPFKNDTGIKCFNMLFSRRQRNEFLKGIEFIGLVFLIPISVFKNYLKFKPRSIILYGIEYFYLVFPFWLISRILNLKLVRIVTDFYSTTTISPVWWKKPKLLFYKIQFTYFDKYLDGIICVSKYLMQLAVDHGVKEQRIQIIPHFIDVKGFSREVKFNNINNYHERKIKVGYCGHVSKENGIFDLIDAFLILLKRYNNTELLIIGEPLNDDITTIKNKFKQNENHLSITGFLEKESVAVALASCDILVNPRISSVLAEAGFPTKLGEYFAVKKPVVSTKTGDIKNYFTDKFELILVEPDNPESIAEGIKYLIKNELEAQQIAENGYIWACDNLDYINNSKILINFIQEI